MTGTSESTIQALAVAVGIESKYEYFHFWSPPSQDPNLLTALGAKLAVGAIGSIVAEIYRDDRSVSERETDLRMLYVLNESIDKLYDGAEKLVTEAHHERYLTPEENRSRTKDTIDQRVTLWSEFKIMYIYACLKAAGYPNPEIIYNADRLRREWARGVTFENLWREGAKILKTGFHIDMTADDAVALGKDKAKEFMWWSD